METTLYNLFQIILSKLRKFVKKETLNIYSSFKIITQVSKYSSLQVCKFPSTFPQTQVYIKISNDPNFFVNDLIVKFWDFKNINVKQHFIIIFEFDVYCPSHSSWAQTIFVHLLIKHIIMTRNLNSLSWWEMLKQMIRSLMMFPCQIFPHQLFLMFQVRVWNFY